MAWPLALRNFIINHNIPYYEFILQQFFPWKDVLLLMGMPKCSFSLWILTLPEVVGLGPYKAQVLSAETWFMINDYISCTV
jgi:hypothetical protein